MRHYRATIWNSGKNLTIYPSFFQIGALLIFVFPTRFQKFFRIWEFLPGHISCIFPAISVFLTAHARKSYFRERIRPRKRKSARKFDGPEIPERKHSMAEFWIPRICVEVAVRLLCIIPDSHGIVLFHQYVPKKFHQYVLLRKRVKK